MVGRVLLDGDIVDLTGEDLAVSYRVEDATVVTLLELRDLRKRRRR